MKLDEAKKVLEDHGYMINEETHYVLDRFGVDTPKLLSNSYLKVRDVDVNTMHRPQRTEARGIRCCLRRASERW